jgi:hypothetical protein
MGDVRASREMNRITATGFESAFESGANSCEVCVVVR